jgi:methylenetetrahydrofolate dehydrogenase (NADP+) / methenyltetrahydrofolate cyclohydrolase
MTAMLIEGKPMALKIRQRIAQKIQERKASGLRAPGLAVVIVGEDPASRLYVDNKQRAAEEVGIVSHLIELAADCTEQQLLSVIDQLNAAPLIDGFLVQLPLPAHMNMQHVIDHIDPRKDVDGFHPFNLGLLAQNRALLRPCTSKGIMHALKEIGLEVSGRHAVVVGASLIVGKPMAMELLNAGATVTVCHRKTQHLSMHTQQADILIAATGCHHLIQAQHVKPGAVVIDVGMTRLENGTWGGDVQFEAVQEKAGFITPVPGGIGPLTVAMLLENTLIAASETAL